MWRFVFSRDPKLFALNPVQEELARRLEQLQLPKSGTKQALRERLRQHAAQQVAARMASVDEQPADPFDGGTPALDNPEQEAAEAKPLYIFGAGNTAVGLLT